MTTPEDREREQRLRELENEIYQEQRLRELENEIYHEQRLSKSKTNSSEPPLYNTRKHNRPENSIQKFGRKVVNLAKFAGFVVAGVALIKVGFFVGMWLTYLIMTGMIAAIGYQIFLKEDK